LDELKTQWQNLTPELQSVLLDGAVVVGALLGGLILGAIVARALRSRNFDAALRLPGLPPPTPEAAHGFTPTMIGGLLVRLTVWTVGAWWLARKHGQVELAQTLALILRRAWALAAVLVAALGVGGMLAQRLIDCLHGAPKAEETPSRNGTAAFPRGAAGVVGAGAYVLTVLLLLLIAADSFDWPLTRSAVVALWQFAQHLLVAGAALFVGGLGARWARELTTATSASAEARVGGYTALGIVATTTVLALAVLLSTAGVLIGLAALALLGLLAWLVRDYLPDVTAGFQLRSHKVREVWLDGAAWQVQEIGLLTAQVGRAGEFCRVQNRLLLKAVLQGAPAEAHAP
jgi:hypothetical protein